MGLTDSAAANVKQLEPPPKKTFNTIEPIYAAALTEECMASVPPIPWIHGLILNHDRRTQLAMQVK